MSKKLIRRIEAWHISRSHREFDRNFYSNQLYYLFYEDWYGPRPLYKEFEILGKLFFMTIGNLWKLKTSPEEYEDSIDRIFLHSDSGPFGKRQPVETAIEWLVTKVHGEVDENQVRKYSLVLLDAILELFATNCKRSQAEAALFSICDHLDCLPEGESYTGDNFDLSATAVLKSSLKEIASKSGMEQYRVTGPNLWEKLPEKIQQ